MLKVKTTKLQELVSKASKGVGNDKARPITSLIAIKQKDGVLTLVTTDYDNYLFVSADVEGEDFYAVVQADPFTRLISRLTCEETELSINGSGKGLEVKGNGTYTIPLTIDDSTGEVVKYPKVDGIDVSSMSKIGEISVTTIGIILSAVKPNLALTLDIPQYTNYYVGNVVLGTDTYKVGCLNKKVTDTPVLISAELMELLETYNADEPIQIYKDDVHIAFEGKNFTAYGFLMEGIENFAVGSMLEYVNSEYPHKCDLPKQELVQLLDRLSIFVSPFDEDIINFKFTADGLQVYSKNNTGVEIVPYTADGGGDVEGSVYLKMLTSQVKTQTGDVIHLSYGDDRSLRMDDPATDMTTVVSLVF